MSLYDIREHPGDIEALIAGLEWRHWAGGQQSLEPLGRIELSVANYSDRGFMVVPYEPWAGKIEDPLINSYLRPRSETGEALQTEVFEKWPLPPTEKPFGDTDSIDKFTNQYDGYLAPSYTKLTVGDSWKRSFKKELAVLLFDPAGKDPKIVLMMKKYVGGAYCAGISMSTDSWLADSGFTPDKDADGSGICDHISEIHTDVCKMSSGEPTGPEISVTLSNVRVKVRAGAWARFNIWDA
jgi:hypothetical protein